MCPSVVSLFFLLWIFLLINHEHRFRSWIRSKWACSSHFVLSLPLTSLCGQFQPSLLFHGLCKSHYIVGIFNFQSLDWRFFLEVPLSLRVSNGAIALLPLQWLYIYVVQILRQKVSMLQARLRQGEVQGYFFVVGPIALPPDSPINMFWLGRCARLTQPTWLTRHPRTILYHIVSSLITHKISQDLTSFCMLLSLLAFVKFGVLECLGALTVLFAFVRTCPLQTWEVVDFVTQMTRWVSAQLSMTLVWTTWFSCWDPSEGSNQRAENILCIANCSLSVYIIYNWVQLSSRVGGLPVQNLALLITVSHTSMRIGQYLPWG